MEIESHNLYGDVSRDEAVRRFPEIDDIRDDTISEAVIGVVQEFPDYFWTAPAATRNHAPEHRQRHGLWLHTKRVVTVFERFSTSMVKQDHLDWFDVDCGRAACILHDMFKYGEPPTSVDGTNDSHDVIAANWLDTHAELPDEVVGAVEAHNGPWYHGKPPSNHLEQVVHMADMTASCEQVRVAVKDPHPVLEEQFSRVSDR